MEGTQAILLNLSRFPRNPQRLHAAAPHQLLRQRRSLSASDRANGPPIDGFRPVQRTASTRPSPEHYLERRSCRCITTRSTVDSPSMFCSVNAVLRGLYDDPEAIRSPASRFMDLLPAAVRAAHTSTLRACAPVSSSTVQPAPPRHAHRWPRSQPCPNGAAWQPLARQSLLTLVADASSVSAGHSLSGRLSSKSSAQGRGSPSSEA